MMYLGLVSIAGVGVAKVIQFSFPDKALFEVTCETVCSCSRML